MERKIQKTYIDTGCGFPVILRDVPLVKVRDVWTPDIDFGKLHNCVLRALAFKPSRLTGKEVAFIRHSFEMILKDFSKRFAVSHPAVLKWEGQGNNPTKMSWSVEKDIRLFIIDQRFNKKDLIELYHELAEPKSAKKSPQTSLDYREVQAA